MTKLILAVCAGCETSIVLYEERVTLQFLRLLAGVLPTYDYFGPNCLPN